MENESQKKIKIKNLTDIVSENLRDEKFSETKNYTSINKDNEKPHLQRMYISSEDADVMNLEASRDISKSNALVKGPRKILHREVRDWIVQPFQNKQNKFNQKTLKNIREIYFEIENSNDKINNAIKKLETQQKKLEMESVMSLAFREVLERIPTKKEVNNYLKQYKNEKFELDNFRIVLKNSKEFFELQEKKIIFEKYRNEITKPIFVIGVPRSGTALIQGILCGHKDLAWMSDKDVGNWLSLQEQFQVHNYYKWLIANKKKIPTSDQALFVLGKKLGKGLENYPKPPKGTSEIPIEGELFWRKYLGRDYVEDSSIDSKIYISKGILEIIKRMKKSRFVNKAPQNSMRLYAIQKIFPDAKFINVVRDPRPVVASMMKRFDDEGEFTMGFPIENKINFDELSQIEKWASKYKQVTEYIYEFFKKQNIENFLTVEYDAIIRDPITVTKKIFEFCELPVPKSLQNIIPPIRKNADEKWHEILTKKDEQRIFDILNPIITKMNYRYNL